MIRYINVFFLFSLFSCSENKSISNLVSANDFNQMIRNDKSAIIIDVRTPEEFNKGHLRNSLNVNWFDENFDENLDTIRQKHFKELMKDANWKKNRN